jgi:hypothetical protein
MPRTTAISEISLSDISAQKDGIPGICFISLHDGRAKVATLAEMSRAEENDLASPPKTSDSDPDSENPYQDAIDRILADFKEVFSKAKADLLPEHRPYDCPIDIRPDAEILFQKLYNLTVDETQTLEDYVN